MPREGNRSEDSLRPTSITLHFTQNPLGSVLIANGNTRVLCTATVDDRVPRFCMEKEQGWVTAEYSLLPGSTQTRTRRERGKVGGRTYEIQRLIGRSLRAVTDLRALRDHTLWLDCDVLQADGGTRCASITGAWVAMVLAIEALIREGKLESWPLLDTVAAISCGIVHSTPLLDLCYSEDVSASVDMNVVMTGSGRLIEVQATGEEATFSRQEFETLLDLAEKGIRELIAIQNDVLQGVLPPHLQTV